ncbi:hypothetical protein GDO78_006047 [Eleutherodactylus coqui]|uniref:Solute carrier family 41 member n=1 Tax=Eleutherodactylus coqui TaxID=57060 RepID=A0A8J6FPR3_ELECQ|nr:hypothetical protein GDO78_006047 [Eleutherodactylus coqui]
MSDKHGSPYTIFTEADPVDFTVSLKSIQSDKFLSLLLSMVPLVCHKGQEDRLKKINGLSPAGHSFNLRADQHLEYHHFSEPNYLGNGPNCSNICSASYDYDTYDYCDGRDVSETDAMLQDGRNPGDGDTDGLLEGSKKLPKESSFTMALQILVPFLLAGFGTVSAGMVLDIVQVNVGKMDSPIEKWNLIIGNLALKQVQATVVGFLAAVAAVILGWIPEGKYRLDHAILLCSSSVATAFIASLLQVGSFFLALTPIWIVVASKHPATKTVLHSGWEPVITAMLISSVGGLILDTTVSDPNLAGIVVYTPVINGIGGNLVAIQASRISTYLHLHNIPGELPDEAAGCFHPCRTFCGTDWMVHHIWRKGKDPDSFSIPYLTALGDLLGTALLAISFHILWLIGDRDGDVGD